MFRMSQWKTGVYTAKLAEIPTLLGQMLEPLADAGVDIFHCSTRHFGVPEFKGSSLHLAGWTKKLTGKPTITVGSIGQSAEFMNPKANQHGKNSGMVRLLEMLEREECDLVAVGRVLLADPAWTVKIQEDRLHEIVPYTREALKSLV